MPAAPFLALRRVLAVGDSQALASFAAAPPCGTRILRAASLADSADALEGDESIDLVLVDASQLASGVRPELVALAARAAVVVVMAREASDVEAGLAWIDGGAEDVLTPDELLGRSGPARLGIALRRRLRRGSDTEWATDLATGLPHRRQLIEHLSQLLALRERDPSAMAVIALRIESRSGVDAERLRRKMAVRLRASVRAGDVVAAIDDDTFCVLLGTMLDAGDGAAVAVKLAALLAEPYPIGGAEVAVSVATGVAAYPSDGNQADRLVRRALALAAVAPALAAGQGAIGRDSNGRAREAANDA